MHRKKRELALEPQSTRIESEGKDSVGLNASINVRNDETVGYPRTNERSGDQLREVKFNFHDGDNVDAEGRGDSIEHNWDHTAVMQPSVGLEYATQTDSVDNVTVEQVFVFLTEQTEDNYVQLAAFPVQPTQEKVPL